MTWTKVGDQHFARPEVMALSRSARLLDLEAKVWCNGQLTDGVIPRAVLARITDAEQPADDAKELVVAGLWDETDTGWVVLSWDTEQEPATRVRERQAAGRERQTRFRDRRERHSRGDHGACDPKYCKSANALRNKSPDALAPPVVTAPRPDPSRPDPKGGPGTEVGDGVRSLGVAPATPTAEVKTTGSTKAGWLIAPTSAPQLPRGEAIA